MAEIVNLRQARKARAKAEESRQAAANRVAHGRNKAQKQAEATAQARREALLDGARQDDERR